MLACSFVWQYELIETKTVNEKINVMDFDVKGVIFIKRLVILLIAGNGLQLSEVRNLKAQNCLNRKTLLNVLNLIANAKNVARSAPLKMHLQLVETPHLA